MALALQATQDELGIIDVLVCGAAGNFLAAAEDLSVNGFRTVVDFDLMGSFHAASLAFAQLRDSNGCILFITAAMASLPHAYQLHVGTKAGIDNMMRNLAREWGGHSILANSIMPGPIEDTEGQRRLSAGNTLGQLADSIPLGRLGKAQEIAAAALFLASPIAQYIPGVVLAVDGGQCLADSAHFNAGAHAFLEEQARFTERATTTVAARGGCALGLQAQGVSIAPDRCTGLGGTLYPSFTNDNTRRQT